MTCADSAAAVEHRTLMRSVFGNVVDLPLTNFDQRSGRRSSGGERQQLAVTRDTVTQQ